MDRQFVISNIHGYLRSFDQMLSEWEPEEELLIIAGNIINYGHNSYLVCRRLLELVRFYPGKVIFLKGKHERFFEEFQKNPHLHYEKYLEEGGLATILSFHEDGVSYEEMNDRNYMLGEILPRVDFTELLSYIISSVEKFETGSSIFLSEGESILGATESIPKSDFRTIFISADEESRFKLHYLNHYLPEELSRQTDLSSEDLGIFRDRYVLLGKEPAGWADAYLWGHHIQNGIVTEISQIPAEE